MLEHNDSEDNRYDKHTWFANQNFCQYWCRYIRDIIALLLSRYCIWSSSLARQQWRHSAMKVLGILLNCTRGELWRYSVRAPWSDVWRHDQLYLFNTKLKWHVKWECHMLVIFKDLNSKIVSCSRFTFEDWFLQGEETLFYSSFDMSFTI